MVDVRIERDMVVFEVLGMHKLWALRRRIKVPRAALHGVRHEGKGVLKRSDMKVYGTNIPGLFGWYLMAGTFRDGGKRVFWDVANVEDALVFDLHDQHFQQLVVQVKDPPRVLHLLGSA